MIANWWVRGGCLAAAFFMAAAVFIGAEAVADVPLFPSPFDKAAHFVYYGLMAALLAHGVGARWLWVALVVGPLIGALDEWHQLSVVGRYASVGDFAADVVGVIVATGTYWWKIKDGSG